LENMGLEGIAVARIGLKLWGDLNDIFLGLALALAYGGMGGWDFPP
jgi:hypothetical protein